MQSRAKIRELYRAKRLALSGHDLYQAALQLKQQLLQKHEISTVQHIAAYIAYNNEINPLSWMQEVYQTKNCYLPIINPSLKQMMFARFKSDTPFTKNQYGILEPAAENQILYAPEQLEIVLLPLVAFDRQGNRIGTGAGYYDRTFAYLNKENAQRKPKLYGLAYEFQKVDNIEPENWDVALDGVITDQNVYLF